ncbi:MAG: hypothetical protein NWE94_08015 [Candidatus Bathyarchaeota archaeon]|nr:hypothetical protein [Candidatus Bathyarchaeota archaeon]
MARTLWFYLGTVLFFVGVLMTALSVSKAIAGVFDLMTVVELISGIILIIVGSRAIRSTHR